MVPAATQPITRPRNGKTRKFHSSPKIGGGFFIEISNKDTGEVILGLRKLINFLEEVMPMKGMTVGIAIEEQEIANIDGEDFPPGD